MNRSPSPDTVITRAIDAFLRNNVFTTEVGVIESYDATTCTASVQPLVMRAIQSENGTQFVRQTVVDDAPVAFLGGGDARLTFPIKRGDECLLLVPSRSGDRWSAFGGEVDPQDTRHHHITDAIVLVTVGLSPATFLPAHATATVLESDDLRLADKDATEAALQGDTFLSTLHTLLNVISAQVGVSGTVPAATAAGAAIATAVTAFINAAATYKSSKVKIG